MVAPNQATTNVEMTNMKTTEPKKEPKKSTMKSMTAFRTLCGNKLDATEVAVEDFAGIVDLNPVQSLLSVTTT